MRAAKDSDPIAPMTIDKRPHALQSTNGGTSLLASGRPRYVQIIASLRQRLAAKEWEPGGALPGESTLAAEYGVSHGTMRKAVDHMVGQNLLVRFQGKGTFVASHNWDRASHFLPMVSEDGTRESPVGRVESVREAVASESEARQLEIRSGSKVVRIRRVRSLGGSPAILERITLPASRFPDLTSRQSDELTGLLYGLYESRYGMVVVEALERLRAVKADATDARLLGVPAGESLLEIDRIALDIKRKPIEWRVSRCNTAHHHYENRIT